MLEGRPERHVWGLGRHHVGSNFFWYLRDPAGNFCEYYSDLDCIVDDALWKPEALEGMRAVQLGSATPPSSPRPGGPGRLHDREPRRYPMNGPSTVNVAIVGYGPVGQALAIRLAERGRRVTVVERRAEPYLLPRAVHFDERDRAGVRRDGPGPGAGHILRAVRLLRLAERCRRDPAPVSTGRAGTGAWPTASMFSQPDLEVVLAARAASLGVVVPPRTPSHRHHRPRRPGWS